MQFHDAVRVRVPAKINLALAVGPRRGDGFHDLTSVFQAVSVYDELTAVASPDNRITLVMSGRGSEDLPTDEQNLAVRAAMLLRERHGTSELGVDLRIHKDIPIAGGMAGGSGDAAAALLACNELWQLDLNLDELRDLGAEIGSDVPFSVLGGNAVGTGRGERLTPLDERGALHWVFALAHGGLSTPGVYRVFDELAAAGRITPDPTLPAGALAELISGDPERTAAVLRNDLCAPALELRPELAETLAVTGDGVLASHLCGSGPTVAFLCRDEASALALMQRLSDTSLVRDVVHGIGPVPGPVTVHEAAHP